MTQTVSIPGVHTGIEGMYGSMVMQSCIDAFLCATQQGMLMMGLPVGELMLGASLSTWHLLYGDFKYFPFPT